MKTKLTLFIGVLLLAAAVPQALWATGACTCVRYHDWRDCGCRMSLAAAGAPASGANQGGGNQANCPTCPSPTGMPRWWVDEPNINLWLTDQPLSYTLSSDQQMTFRWYYKQRFKLPEPDECPTLYVTGTSAYPRLRTDPYVSHARNFNMTNASWGHQWMMDIVFWDQAWDSLPTYPNPGSDKRVTTQPFSDGYEALVFRPEGGVYYLGSTAPANFFPSEPLSGVTLQPLSGGYPVATNTQAYNDGKTICWGIPGTGLKLVYADGSQDVFGLALYVNGTPTMRGGDTTARAYLTQRIDPQGRVTQLGYEKTYFTNSWNPKYPPSAEYAAYRLRYVVDPDGRTNTFYYNANAPQHAWQVSEIDDPYGRKASFSYDSNGRLFTITDAATNTSSFGYQGPNGWITSLSTPYGATSFTHFEVPDPSVTNGFSQRAVYVSEPEGAHQLYYFVHHNNILPTTASSPVIPGQTFDDGNCGTNHSTLDYRNTFHWDRRQFDTLSPSVTSQLPGNMAGALASLGLTDFQRARLKHWLWQVDGISISQSLSSERDPSPDALGVTEGARTWYDYANKNYGCDTEGDAQVNCIARGLPDGTSQYVCYSYYGGVPLVSNNRSSYSLPGGGTGELTTSFYYAANGIDLVRVSDSLGRWTGLTYNTNHQPIFITNSLNQVTSLRWDGASHNLTNLSLPSGLSAILNYYPSNSLAPNGSMLQSLSWPGIGRSLSFTYANSLVQTVQDDLGLSLSATWDGLNRFTGASFPDNTTVSNVYNRLNLSAQKDRLGHWSYYGYDGLEHMTNFTDALSNVTQLSWCDCGALSTITDPLKKTTNLQHNNQGLLTGLLFPDQSSLTYNWDLSGRLTNVVDGAGRSLSAGYNNQGLLTSVSNAYGRLWQVYYDAANRPLQVTDANNVTVTNSFDLLNRLLARSWPDRVSEGFGWATNGLATYTNRNRQVTAYGRDVAGRLLTLTNANREVTRVLYNSVGQITDLWDGRANHTGWTYNQYGWLLGKTNALGQTAFVYTCDPNGQVTNRWTPQFGNTAYSFDAVGNLRSIHYPLSTINYFYDALNRLTNMVDAAGSTTFAYTETSQLQSEDGPWVNDALSYGYSQQLRQTLNLVQPGGNWQQNYGFDSAWRLQSLSSPAGAFGYSYDALRSTLPTLLSLPNSAWVTNHYDSLARLDYTGLANRWGHVLDGYGYGYDLLGQRTNIFRDFGFAASSVAVGYDAIGQLTSWSASETNNGLRANEQFGFGYDPAHNLGSRTNGALVQSFVCDPANALTNVTRTGTLTLSGVTPGPASSVTVNGQAAQRYNDFTFAAPGQSLADGPNPFTIVAQPPGSGSATQNLSANLPRSLVLGYDLNGNLTNNGTLAMFYDAENRLTNVTCDSTWKSEFVYDGLGRRRIERDYAWQGGAWAETNELHFVYDGLLLIQERDGNNVPLVTYTRGLDLGGGLQSAGGIGGLLARTDGSGSTFYHADGAGNITGLIDGNQNMAARYLYGAFGRLSGKWGPLADANGMQFSSMPLHHQSGLSLFAFRGYDPSMQRWLQRDPIGEVGGINLYGFVGNNPMSYGDPDGRGLLSFVAGYGWSGDAADEFETSIGESAIEQGNEMAAGLDVLRQDGLMGSRELLVDEMSDRYAAMMLNYGEGSMYAIAANDLTGGTSLMEALYGLDLQSQCELSQQDRWQRGLMGGGELGLTAAGGASILNSARAGYTGIGFGAAAKTISTGRTVPKSLKEKLAMEEVMSKPMGTTPPRMPPMSDTKNNLLAADGWVKRVQNVNGVEIHYVENTKTGQVLDFKFKD